MLNYIFFSFYCVPNIDISLYCLKNTDTPSHTVHCHVNRKTRISNCKPN